jgi:hypothetical protein
MSALMMDGAGIASIAFMDEIMGRLLLHDSAVLLLRSAL